MDMRQLGGAGPRVSAIGLGCMGMSGMYGPADEAESIATIHAALDAGGSSFLESAAQRLGWSARGYHRTLRVARSIADLAGSAAITLPQLAEAIQYRRVLVSR